MGRFGKGIYDVSGVSAECIFGVLCSPGELRPLVFVALAEGVSKLFLRLGAVLDAGVPVMLSSLDVCQMTVFIKRQMELTLQIHPHWWHAWESG